MWFRRVSQQFSKKFTRNFGSHYSKEFDPHVPQFYNVLGKSCLIATYLWVFFSFKANNGQILGIYQPWLHEHEHEHHSFEESEEEDLIPASDAGHEEEHEEEEEEPL